MPADVTTPDQLPSREEQTVDRAEAYVAALIERAKRTARDMWHVARFLVFFVYLLLGLLVFWLWVFESMIGVFRFFLRSAMIVLLWLSGGIAPRPGPPPASVAEAISRDLKYFWAGRVRTYDRIARTGAAHFMAGKRATRTFWHWPKR